MSMNTTLTPRSRRDRPAKPPLSRDKIIATALAIVQQDGLQKVTMRRIAADLDTGPASLYVYVRNTEELHALLLDALLEQLPGERLQGESPAIQLHRLLWAYTQVLYDHPEIARIAMFTLPNGRYYLRLVDSMLGLLIEGGASSKDAAWAVDMLLLYATMTAIEQSMRAAKGTEISEIAALVRAVDTLDPETYPHIARVGKDDLLGGEQQQRFDWGIDVILRGIASAALPPADTATTPAASPAS